MDPTHARTLATGWSATPHLPRSLQRRASADPPKATGRRATRSLRVTLAVIFGMKIKEMNISKIDQVTTTVEIVVSH
jgi:hypothetical protein